jgi:enterobacterial common antigen flippase
MPFARILRSSALMGGAQVVVLAAAFVRAKAIAMILGASGVGLIGIFNAFSGNVASFAGWGLGTSGVRLIAGAPDEQKPAKIAAVRRMGWTLSLLGLALALLLFWPVGSATFASSQYAAEMAIVACAVPCVIASSAWSAVLQASGKVASLAKVQIAGALAGLLLGLPAIFLWGTIGIALSILFAAAVPAFVLWRAARAECHVSAGSSPESADLGRLVKLGGALMLVGWLGQLSAYVVRLAIVRSEGLDAAGYYQAAFAISGSLPGFVFAAMGADFFPRVAAAKDEEEAIGITQIQIQAGLLLGVPLIALLFLFGELSIRMLYARGLDPATSLLPWMTWAVFMRVVSWPLGFWLIARGKPSLVVGLEAASNILLIVTALFLTRAMGVLGAAIATFLAGLAYFIVLAFVAHRKAGGISGRRTWAGIMLAAFALGAAHLFSSAHSHVAWRIIYSVLLTCSATWIYLKATRPRSDVGVSD